MPTRIMLTRPVTLECVSGNYVAITFAPLVRRVMDLYTLSDGTLQARYQRDDGEWAGTVTVDDFEALDLVEDPLADEIQQALFGGDLLMTYEEADPDLFPGLYNVRALQGASKTYPGLVVLVQLIRSPKPGQLTYATHGEYDPNSED